MVEKVKIPTISSQFTRASGMAEPVRNSDLRNKAQDRQNNTGKQRQRRSAGITAPAFSCDRKCNPEGTAARQGSRTSRDTDRNSRSTRRTSDNTGSLLSGATMP